MIALTQSRSSVPSPSCHNSPIQQRRQGFTLVELLVIAPIAIIVIAGIIALMVALVGDTIISRDRSVNAYNLQNALDRVEQDARLATLFLDSYSLLSSPQGRDDATGGFSSSSPNNDLIINQFATTTSPLNTTRQIVYYKDQPNPCGASKMLNSPLTIKVIYFIKNGSLWRRTVVPEWSLSATDQTGVCDTPWQRDSCSLSATFNAYCQARDELILDNVSSMTTTYYTPLNVVTTNPISASSIQVTIGQSKSVAGETISTSGVARTVRTNSSLDTLPDAPANLRIYNQGSTDANHPLKSSFTWDPAKSARYYMARYKVNSGAWSSYTNLLSLIFPVTAGRPLDTITIGIVSVNDIGQSAETQFTVQRPLWTNCELKNGWTNYGAPHDTAGFTLTSANWLVMKGLVTGGAGTSTICWLPASLAILKPNIFPSAIGTGSYGGMGRIDAYPDGQIASVGNSGWVSLTQTRFIIANNSLTWNNPSFVNGWTQLDPTYWQPLTYTVDTVGRFYATGVIRSGTTTDNATIAYLSSTKPGSYYHFTGVGSSANNFSPNGMTNGSGTYSELLAKGYAVPDWESIQDLFYTSTYTGWTNMTLQNSWVNYGGGTPPFTTAQYTKGSDNLVTIRGLIKNPTISGKCPLWQPIAVLPAGYRPKEHQVYMLYTNAGAGRLDIKSDGTIACIDLPGGFVALEGVHFMAEQ